MMRAQWCLFFSLVVTVVTGCVGEETEQFDRVSESDVPADLADEDHPAAGHEPIYDPAADGAELIAAALQRARMEHKRVLIQWGDNSCMWCYRLHDVFEHDGQVRPLVFNDYELVLIDGETNHELMEQYAGAGRRYTFPHLTILDAEGNVLVNQNTEPLEDGPQHDPAKVAALLGKWAPETLDAETLLASALQQAADENKRVLLHVGTPACGWCRVLSRFLHDHESQLAGDYIDLKIDTVRMTHGAEVAERFHPEGSQGVPWMVILDPAGKVLTTSVGPQGNCGYPYHPQEVDHFIGMLTTTRQRMTDEDLAAVRAGLEAYRKKREGE